MPQGLSVLTGRPLIAAGQRNKRVVIQQRTTGETVTGYPVDDWDDLVTVYMAKLDQFGIERYAANLDTASLTSEWHMPYMQSMDPERVAVPKDRRLRYEGRIYDIMAANRMGIGQTLGIRLVTIAKADAP